MAVSSAIRPRRNRPAETPPSHTATPRGSRASACSARRKSTLLPRGSTCTSARRSSQARVAAGIARVVKTTIGAPGVRKPSCPGADRRGWKNHPQGLRGPALPQPPLLERPHGKRHRHVVRFQGPPPDKQRITSRPYLQQPALVPVRSEPCGHMPPGGNLAVNRHGKIRLHQRHPSFAVPRSLSSSRSTSLCMSRRLIVSRSDAL